MTDFEKRMIELQEEKNDLLRQALFPKGTCNNGVFEEIVCQIIENNNNLYKINQSIECVSESISEKK